MTNPFYDPYRVLLKVYGEGARLKLALSGTDLEELNRARTVKIVYGVLEHDRYLARCITAFAEKTPKQSVRVLLKVALYNLIYLEKPRYYVADTAVELIKKPALLAVAVGLVLYLGQIPVPYLIAQPISLLAGMNTPLSMLITGIIIATSDLRPVIRSFQLWHAILIRMLIIPAASFLFCLLTGTGGMVGAVVILLEACPCAALTSVLAIQYRYSEQLAAGLVVLSTLLSIVTLPLCAMFVQMMG